MFFLTIETSCDDTSIAIFENNQLLSMNTKSQNIHEKYGGIIPEMASREHTNSIDELIKFTLKDANLTLQQMEAIVVTQGPGLINTLQIGLVVAKTLATLYEIDLYVINHLEGHVYSAFINQNYEDVPKKAIVLIASGGHTILFRKDGFKYNLISKTRDDAVGEAFDKVARILELGYPGGKIIDEISQKFDLSEKFPNPKIILKNSLDFSYSGLKSNVLKLSKTNEFSKEAIAYSFTQAAINQLITKTNQAIKQYQINNLIIGGGVSANSFLRKGFDKTHINVFQPSMKFTTDNAAMIGTAFYFRYTNGLIKKASLTVDSLPKLKLFKK